VSRVVAMRHVGALLPVLHRVGSATRCECGIGLCKRTVRSIFKGTLTGTWRRGPGPGREGSLMRSATLAAAVLTICVASACAHSQSTRQPAAVGQSTNAPPPPASAGAFNSGAGAAPSSSSTAAVDNQGRPVIHVSKDYIRRLANEGFYPKNDKGQLVYCVKDAINGSRFKRERCMDSNQLEVELQRRQAQRDQLQSVTCTGGPSCK